MRTRGPADPRAADTERAGLDDVLSELPHKHRAHPDARFSRATFTASRRSSSAASASRLIPRQLDQVTHARRRTNTSCAGCETKISREKQSRSAVAWSPSNTARRIRATCASPLAISKRCGWPDHNVSSLSGIVSRRGCPTQARPGDHCQAPMHRVRLGRETLPDHVHAAISGLRRPLRRRLAGSSGDGGSRGCGTAGLEKAPTGDFGHGVLWSDRARWFHRPLVEVCDTEVGLSGVS